MAQVHEPAAQAAASATPRACECVGRCDGDERAGEEAWLRVKIILAFLLFAGVHIWLMSVADKKAQRLIDLERNIATLLDNARTIVLSSR